MAIPSPNITLTGTFIDSQGNAVNGGTVTATLQNYGGQVAMIAGSAILETAVVSTTMTGTNSFSISLYANDQISPSGTWWNVAYPGPGSSTTTKNYQLNGVGSFDLSNLTPLNQPATAATVVGQTLVQPFTAVSHKFLTGMTTAGALIAAQPAASDLSNGTTGSGLVVLATSPTLTTPNIGSATATSITSYGGVSTVAGGIPAIVAKADLTAQAANVGSALLYAVPANGAGMYRVSAYIEITQAATVSSTMPHCIVSSTTNDSSVVSAPIITQVGLTNNVVGLNSSQGNQGQSVGIITINVKASTNITFNTNNYASSGATPMQYAVHIKLEYLGN